MPEGIPPAEDVDFPPVWDREGVRWDYVPNDGLFICSDTSYAGPGARDPGSIPRDRQPYYAHPPNLAQRIAAQIHEDER